MSDPSDFEPEVVAPEATESAEVQPSADQAVSARTDSEAVEGWEQIDPTTPGPTARDHAKAVANARQKVREEFEQQYGWASGLDPQAVQAALTDYNYRQHDLPGYVTALASQVPQLRERLLGQATADVPTKGPEYPQPKLDNYTGQYFYSQADLEKIRELDRQEYGRALDERLKPFEERFQHADQQTQQQRQTQAQIDEYEQTLEGFRELEPAIVREMSADRRLSMLGAYRRVFKQEYLPKLRSGERDTTMKTLRTKAAAQSELGPSKSHDTKSVRHRASNAKRGFEKVFAELATEAG